MTVRLIFPTHSLLFVIAVSAAFACTHACTPQVSGVVLTVACEPYLESEYGSEWVGEAPIKLLDKLSEMPGQAGEEVVVVGQVLADEATLGYEDVSNMRVSWHGLPTHL
jgi:hypothetical protein